MVESPETRYAKSGEVHIAYQVVGEGPPDLVSIPSQAHHVELNWENASMTKFPPRLNLAITDLISGLGDGGPSPRCSRPPIRSGRLPLFLSTRPDAQESLVREFSAPARRERTSCEGRGTRR